MRQLSRAVKRENKAIGLVPTMGCLHDGHCSLIKKARAENDFIVLSVFVNPVQFGPAEDFAKYPRDFKHDRLLAEKEKADCIFYPQAKDMYPEGYKTFVAVEDLSRRLCGGSRPTHFRGVTTVATKLFNIVMPDTAYFGQKDAQQSIIVKKMAADLNMPVKIKILPTVRETDGLAMSSRNKYLSFQERTDAPVLYAALKEAQKLIKNGVDSADKIKKTIAERITAKKTARLEYVEIVDAENLKAVKKIEDKTLIAVACRFGKARLIDNVIIRKI